ncbi:ROK family protein [Clostridium folliculivorans]|uniref:Sugar kinase n=1 Tax=Clostridium folliculivorans TaxID=2886038 RepID=A0A9W5Y4G3_9CLOT|nr:ROK family protein [Clostridium folliculivorans]GKU26473.1 sugar kinase [Clostridium folliculivorans]GKU29095.1 sugar kinase [Clostridium folliculivorans]
MEFLVLDVGGSSIKYAVMNEKAEFFEKGKVPTPVDKIENFINSVGEIYDIYKHRVKGIAMSMPGRIDSDRGYLYTGGSLEYNTNKEIVALLQKRCPVPITVENDGKCAALAEAWLGSLKDCEDGIVVILGTGVGGGIIKDKKLHKGKNFIAGEFSFIFTNNAAFQSEYSHMWAGQAGVSGLCIPVAKIKNLPIEEVDGVKVFEYANAGDKDVLNILDDYCYRLVLQLFNLQYIYDPERISIGGGISKQEVLIKYIKTNIEKHFNKLNPNIGIKPEVTTCKFYNDSNLIGALYNYLIK